MKQKATRDLPKLRDKHIVIAKILSGLKFGRWILLCPFLDDKAVVSHVRAKGMEIRSLGLPFLAEDFEALVQSQEDFAKEIADQVEYDIKYSGYIARQQVQVERQNRMADKAIPLDFNYEAIISLRAEARQKLGRIRPINLDQASRISGITPADISLVLAYIENPKLRGRANSNAESIPPDA